jgi:hypothetical protein
VTNNLETMKLALDALEWEWGGEPCGTWEAITALRQTISEAEQAEQEPVTCACDSKAWCKQYNKCNREMLGMEPYTAPPQQGACTVCKREWVSHCRPWQDLTDDEILGVVYKDYDRPMSLIDIARAIEAALKEKNT